MKGTFLKSPTGVYRLGYSTGDRADLKHLDADVIEDLIESGYFMPDAPDKDIKKHTDKQFRRSAKTK